LNLIVEIAPYTDILRLNGWTYKSLPLILIICSFRDLYLSLYKYGKAVLSFVIIHPFVLQKLKSDGYIEKKKGVDNNLGMSEYDMNGILSCKIQFRS
jgi:hypothetical protein